MSSSSNPIDANQVAFTGISYEQLVQLVNSCTLFNDEDRKSFLSVYPSTSSPSDIDKAFNVTLEAELKVLDLQTADLNQQLQGDLKEDSSTKELQQKYLDRIQVLERLIDVLVEAQKSKAS